MPVVRAGDLPYTGVPTQEPSLSVPDAYQRIRATPEDFGAGVGAATERLGAQFERAGNVLAENAIARQRLENDVRADDATNKYQESLTKLLYGDPANPGDVGFYGKRGEDAIREYPNISRSIMDLRNQMRGQLPNDMQRIKFDQETRRIANYAASQMGAHYDREFKTYGTAVNIAGTKNSMAAAASALESGDQAKFETELGNTMRFKFKQAELDGTAGNEEVRNNIMASVREDGVKMQFQKLAETNPYKAWQFLDVNSDALKPGEAHALRQSVAAKYNDVRAKIDAGEMPAPQGWNEKPPERPNPIGDTKTTGTGHIVPKAERLAYYKQQAEKLGLNYKAIEATVANEGLNNYIGDNGQSFGDFQLYTGGGMGNAALEAGIDVRNPTTWKQQADFAMAQMVEHKGDAEWFNGQWHGPRNFAPWAAHSFSNGLAAAHYETTLTSSEEAKFQEWKRRYAPNDSGADYDLRGAFKAGLTPDPISGHWPDTFKKPNHPTFSDQSIYAKDKPDLAGRWEGEQYIKPNKQTILIAGDTDTVTGQMRPSIKAMPIEPPEPGTLPDAEVPGLQDKIAEIASQPWAKDDPTRLNAAIKAARQGASARWTDSQRELRLHNEQIKAQDEILANQFITRSASANPPTIAEVSQSPLTASRKESVIRFLERPDKSDPATAVSKTNTLDLFTRMQPGYAGPDRVTDEKAINDAYSGQKVTRADHDWLINHFKINRTEEGQKVSQFVDRHVKAFVHFTQDPLLEAMRLANPTGAATNDVRRMDFEDAARDLITKQLREGKPTSDLMRRTNKDDPLSSPIGELARSFSPPATSAITTPTPSKPPPNMSDPNVIKSLWFDGQISREQAIEHLKKLPGWTD